jgi:hypothetical protein
LETAIIFTKAYFESQRKSIKSCRRESSKYIIGCCHCSTFLIDWRKAKHSHAMAVDKFVDHSPVCGHSNTETKNKVTNYLFKDLVPVIVPSYIKHRKKGLNMKASFVRDILSPYLNNSDTISDMMCSKMKQHAEHLAFGSIVEQGPLLDQVAALCIEKGHKCNVHHVTKNKQASILFDNRKAEHMAVMKHVLKENRIPFKGLLAGDTQLLNLFNDDDKILYGWDFAPSWAKLIFPNLRPLFYSDGAHMKTALNGTLFSLWGIDANDQIVLLAISLYYDNEGEDTWNKFLSFVKNVYPEINSNASTIMADGEKGFAKVMKCQLKRMNNFFCSQHEKSHISKYDREIYTKAIKAGTRNKLNQLKKNTLTVHRSAGAI